ncbi:uncharacterized protein [Watersipora subatra]|uniref:uncharacterized protein n=1 Tax=Watersipora subatra TaxID=2589382 RepID=UPI00355B578E
MEKELAKVLEGLEKGLEEQLVKGLDLSQVKELEAVLTKGSEEEVAEDLEEKLVEGLDLDWVQELNKDLAKGLEPNLEKAQQDTKSMDTYYHHLPTPSLDWLICWSG